MASAFATPLSEDEARASVRGRPFPKGESPLRWIYLAIVIVVAAATLIFALQNLQIVSVAFLGLAISAPLALMTFIVYILGP